MLALGHPLQRPHARLRDLAASHLGGDGIADPRQAHHVVVRRASIVLDRMRQSGFTVPEVFEIVKEGSAPAVALGQAEAAPRWRRVVESRGAP